MPKTGHFHIIPSAHSIKKNYRSYRLQLNKYLTQGLTYEALKAELDNNSVLSAEDKDVLLFDYKKKMDEAENNPNKIAKNTASNKLSNGILPDSEFQAFNDEQKRVFLQVYFKKFRSIEDLFLKKVTRNQKLKIKATRQTLEALYNAYLEKYKQFLGANEPLVTEVISQSRPAAFRSVAIEMEECERKRTTFNSAIQSALKIYGIPDENENRAVAADALVLMAWRHSVVVPITRDNMQVPQGSPSFRT